MSTKAMIAAMVMVGLGTFGAGCAAESDGAGDTGKGEDAVNGTAAPLKPVATSAKIELRMVKLVPELIVSEVATPSADDIKPGFELELFAETTLRKVAGLHDAAGIALADRQFVAVNFAPVSAVAVRPSGRQDASFYFDLADPSEAARDHVRVLPTEYTARVPYTGKPGVSLTESACDLGEVPTDLYAPYPGAAPVGAGLKDGRVNTAILALGQAQKVKIRLAAQVERCAGPITSAAQANAEPRLCYEKLEWLQKNGGEAGLATELGRLSAYVDTLTDAQLSMCGD